MAKLSPNSGLYGGRPSQVDQWNSYGFSLQGGFVKASTTGSTQASGATGALLVRCNLSTGAIFMNGKSLNILTSATGADRADFECFNANSFIVSGNAAYFHVVAYDNKGANEITLKAYYGASATSGDEEPLSDDELDDMPELANNDWIELGRFIIHRTADEVVDEKGFDYSGRPAGNRTEI